MIQEKDASTPCDERHVKYRRNTNLLTQKNTGGKRIMGNQGTTNWKLTAFFAISLMLIAGSVQQRRNRSEWRRNDNGWLD